MQVKYAGPSGSGVDVVHPDPAAPDANTVTHCPPGETVELPDEQAASLVDVGVLEAVGAAGKRHGGTQPATSDDTGEG